MEKKQAKGNMENSLYRSLKLQLFSESLITSNLGRCFWIVSDTTSEKLVTYILQKGSAKITEVHNMHN